MAQRLETPSSDRLLQQVVCRRGEAATPVGMFVDRAGQVGLFGAAQNVVDRHQRKRRRCAGDELDRGVDHGRCLIGRRCRAGGDAGRRDGAPKRGAICLPLFGFACAGAAERLAQLQAQNAKPAEKLASLVELEEQPAQQTASEAQA